MSDIKLGNLITTPQHRDAIHIAIAPVTSDETILPGQHLALVEGTTDRVRIASPCVGIADPFLPSAVPPGKQFWLCLYPQTVTQLRHEWTHPSFIAASSVGAQEWITAFSAKWKYSFDEFMAAARQYLQHNHLLDDKWEQLDDITDEEWITFWSHFHTLTGLSLNGKDANFVTCCP